jgi:hypothetical protein
LNLAKTEALPGRCNIVALAGEMAARAVKHCLNWNTKIYAIVQALAEKLLGDTENLLYALNARVVVN